MTGKVDGSKEGLAGKKENPKKKKKKTQTIGMTEIKDSYRPRAEIKCGAGKEGGASLIESLTAGKSRRSKQLRYKKIQAYAYI